MAGCVDAGFAEGEHGLGDVFVWLIFAEFDEEMEEGWAGGQDDTLRLLVGVR